MEVAKDTSWLENLNVACYKHFIIKQEGLGTRTGKDNLAAHKYDAYENAIYSLLNRVIIRKHIEDKKRNELPKESRPKKSLLPFLTNYDK